MPADVCDGGACHRPLDPSYAVIAVFLGRDHGALSQTIKLASSAYYEQPFDAGYIGGIGAVGDLDRDGFTDLAVVWDQVDTSRCCSSTARAPGSHRRRTRQSIFLDQPDVQWANLAPRAAGIPTATVTPMW